MRQLAPHDLSDKGEAPGLTIIQEEQSQGTAPSAALPTRKRTATVVGDGGAIYHVVHAPRIGRRSRRRFALSFAVAVAIVGVIAVLGAGFATSTPMSGSGADPNGTHLSIASGLQATALAQALPTIVAPRAAAHDTSTGTMAQSQLVRTEAALRTGEFGATVDFGNGARTVTDVRFDFGGYGSESRFHIARTYGGATGTHTQELIAVGDRTWQRVDGGAWSIVSVPIAVREQVRALLPDVNGATNLAPTRQGAEIAFRWSDGDRNADVTLIVDGATGVPQRLQQVTHPTGATLSVTYTGWNTAVDVRPPA